MLEYRTNMGKLIKIPMVIKTFGNSMFPLLLDGDVLYLKKIKFGKIRVNDIITVKNKNNYFTHRVIYKGNNFLVTKGDNNHETDSKVYPKDIVGIVENVKRQGNIFNPEQIYLLQSSLYFAEIVKIKNILEKNKIEHVFLKGLPLHLYFEKTHPRRIYADCDILIRPEDFPKIRTILKKFGYKKIEDSLSEKHKEIKNKESEISFAKLMNGFHVVFDIHFEIVFMMTQLGELNALYPQEMINSLTDDLIKEKRTINVQNENFPILSATHLPLYLCLHLFHHNFIGPYRYDFINTVIGKNKLDEKKAIEIIKKYRLENFVYPCLFLLKKYYQGPISNNILNSLKPPENTYKFIKENILNVDILNEEERIGSGIKRFKMIFFLSPFPFYRKVLVFLNKEVLYSVFWVLYRKINSYKNQNPLSL